MYRLACPCPRSDSTVTFTSDWICFLPTQTSSIGQTKTMRQRHAPANGKIPFSPRAIFSQSKNSADLPKITRLILLIQNLMAFYWQCRNSWAKVNNMDFNNNKFELLRYGGNTELKQVHEGPGSHHMSNDGTFSEHISRTISFFGNFFLIW